MAAVGAAIRGSRAARRLAQPAVPTAAERRENPARPGDFGSGDSRSPCRGKWGEENQAAGEIGVLSGRQVSTCWISGGNIFPKDLGSYFRIFWRVLGQIFPSASRHPPPLRLHKKCSGVQKKKIK